ncbi:MAG: RNA methyltransferase, partial [Saprospiraceae bacterium]|nr:RNA methyltransferase [Saprospiraceae bacterium]
MSSPPSMLHPLLVRLVAQNLRAIFQENRYADKVIEQALRSNPKAGSRDRAFVAETTYEVVRYYRLYVEILGITPNTEADFWQLIGVHLAFKNIDLPDWQEFKPLKTKAFYAKIKNWQQER